MASFPDPSQHPSWCSPEHCTDPAMLAVRGERRPLFGGDRDHRSAPRTVTSRPGGTEFEIFVWKDVAEPLDEGVLGIEIVVRQTDSRFVASLVLDPGQPEQLIEALTWAVELAATGTVQ